MTNKSNNINYFTTNGLLNPVMNLTTGQTKRFRYVSAFYLIWYVDKCRSFNICWWVSHLQRGKKRSRTKRLYRVQCIDCTSNPTNGFLCGKMLPKKSKIGKRSGKIWKHFVFVSCFVLQPRGINLVSFSLTSGVKTEKDRIIFHICFETLFKNVSV